MLASRSEPPPLVDLPHPLRGIDTWACGEDYRLVADQEREMRDMSMDSAREDLRLDIAPQADIVCGAFRMCDQDRVLLYDLLLIEVRRHVLSGGPDQFNSSGKGLVVGVRALEARQVCVVHVD